MDDGFSLGIICYTLTILKIVATLVRDAFGFICNGGGLLCLEIIWLLR